MRPRRAWFGALIGACLLAIPLSTAVAQAPLNVKTWTFTLPHGTLQIDLQAYPDGTSALYIGPSHQGYEAPVANR
jgi:hypothetical protein